MFRVTIGIPTFNRVEAITRSVMHLLDYKEQVRINILVIDNASTDGTFDELLQFEKFENFQVLKNSNNLGYAGNILRLFECCRTQYLILMSDEDEIFIDNLTIYLEYIEKVRPNFISPQAFIDGAIYRGRSHTSEISIDDFKRCSFYLSGLTFKVEKCLDSLKYIADNRTNNSALEVYPQVVLALFILGLEGGCFWWGRELVNKREQLPSKIFDIGGVNYYEVRARWMQYLGFIRCFKVLISRPNCKDKEALHNSLSMHRLSILTSAFRRLGAVMVILRKLLLNEK